MRAPSALRRWRTLAIATVALAAGVALAGLAWATWKATLDPRVVVPWLQVMSWCG